MTLPKQRVLAVALDACDKDIVLSFVADGRMPNVAALLERGAWAPTRNPPGLFVGAVWPTIYTGLSPSTHGRYCFRQLVPNTYLVHDTAVATAVHGRPFWAQLSDAGKRIAVFDVPHSFVVEGLNGIQVVDWGAHDANPGFQAVPESFAAELRDFPTHPVGVDCNGDRRTAEQFVSLRDHLLGGIDLRVEMAERYLAREPWDFFLYVFSEAHCVGHQCWHVHDPSHPRHERAVSEACGDPLLAVYSALDDAIGRLLAQAGPDTSFVLLLSHGMGPHYGGNFLLEDVLRRIDRASLPLAGRLRASARERMRRHAPSLLRRALRSRRQRQADTTASERHVESKKVRALPIDPGTRRCFAVPNNDVYGAIRLNLVGREPRGTVQPEDAHDVISSLTAELLALRNDDTGSRVVRRVIQTSDHYDGERTGDLPDLFVEWNWDDPISSVSSPTVGRVTKDDPETRTGDHRPDGLIVAVGPDVTPGRIDGKMASVDIAPTLAAMCGVELHDVEGTPIQGMTPVVVERLEPR